MSNGGGFPEVIRVLQTVGTQISLHYPTLRPSGQESDRTDGIYPLFQ